MNEERVRALAAMQRLRTAVGAPVLVSDVEMYDEIEEASNALADWADAVARSQSLVCIQMRGRPVEQIEAAGTAMRLCCPPDGSKDSRVLMAVNSQLGLYLAYWGGVRAPATFTHTGSGYRVGFLGT